ncbi:MAG: acetyl-CoA carboxylase, carboxyltransferase subunit beta [Myxococcota bacterium]
MTKLEAVGKKSVPKGLWAKCDGCAAVYLTEDLVANLRVCPKCDHHFAMPTPERVRATLDAGTFVEEDAGLAPRDPLEFTDTKRYADRLRSARRQTGGHDAFVAGHGTIEGRAVECGFFVFEFMGGSMGSVVGEKIARLFERARERRRPAIVFSSSGGARMQEGVLSLVQMAKTTAALARLREARVPFLSVLLDPTMGGVAASFAMLGDVNLAEPRALIGFAGPRVIEQTIRQKLPEGFQRSEYLLEHGMIDMIVHRRDLRARLARLVALLDPSRG